MAGWCRVNPKRWHETSDFYGQRRPLRHAMDKVKGVGIFQNSQHYSALFLPSCYPLHHCHLHRSSEKSWSRPQSWRRRVASWLEPPRSCGRRSSAWSKRLVLWSSLEEHREHVDGDGSVKSRCDGSALLLGGDTYQKEN